MDKKSLRKKYKSLRHQLTDEQRDEMSLQIANQVLQLPIWDFSFYHLFMPIERLNEVDTSYILNILYGKDKNVVLSKTDFENHSMQHFLLTDQTLLKKNEWGIVEPTEGIEITEKQIQIVFVPLLVYDKKGNRVGYGKGFYDDFLSKCTPNTIKIGLSFFEAEEIIEDVSPEDIPLNYCVTPTKIYQF